MLSGAKDNTLTVALSELPVGSVLKSTLTYNGNLHEATKHPFVLTITNHTSNTTFYLHLSLETVPPVPPGGGGGGSGTIPSVPDTPVTPDVPVNPDTPGSDEPLVPILPPADSVYNFAGFIPLLAGFFLLFLLVAFRGNLVYRILKKHAKRHGEKPDKEEKKQLKATASAIILLIRDEERYGEWRKNREMEMRLSADIISVLDEMQYPPQIPRGAAAAEILKAAKGRINRHRL